MASIGEELHRERVRRGLTFKDVEQVLHIRSAYLEAIEDGNFKLIPGHVYTKGFIRNYANYLGLDGQRLVVSYQNLIGEKHAFTVRTLDRKRKKAQKEQLQTEYEEHTVEKKRISLETRQRKRQKTMAQERMVLGTILVLIVLFLIWLFFL